MSCWGIAETAPAIEKIKAELADGRSTAIRLGGEKWLNGLGKSSRVADADKKSGSNTREKNKEMAVTQKF